MPQLLYIYIYRYDHRLHEEDLKSYGCPTKRHCGGQFEIIRKTIMGRNPATMPIISSMLILTYNRNTLKQINEAEKTT